MVKNTKGGKGSKGLARKMFAEDNVRRIIRKPECELEDFAVVTKMYGTMCEIQTCNGKSYKCHIRGKFRGRSKRNSIVSVGKIIMVGFREFEKPNFTCCDLLEIFEPNEVNELQRMPDINIRPLITISNNDNLEGSSKDRGSERDNELFDFSEEIIDDKDRERVQTLLYSTTDTDKENKKEIIETEEGEIVSFDDI
jgi:translation initiation factor IF-1